MYVSHVPLGASAAQNAGSLTTAIEQASDLGGGRVVIDAGTFPVDTVLLKSNVLIEGAGMDATVLVQADTLGDSYGTFYAESASTGSFVESITIRDLTLKNTVVETMGALFPLNHLVALSGVRDVLIERVKFQGFQGDGICLHGRIVSAVEERHNVNVTIRDCIFDGEDHSNRQGVTIVDCDGLVIDNCLFENCTHSTMPGAIDFEPDYDFNVIRNALVNGCVFRNVGGSVATIAVHIGSGIPVPVGISITNNFFRDYAGSGGEVYVNVNRTMGANDPDMALLISGNCGSGGNIGLYLFDAKGITSVNNTWDDYLIYGLQLGATGIPRDVAISDRFIRCGNFANYPYGGAVANVDGLRLNGTEFIDCGDGLGDATALYFVGAPGASNNVDLSGAKVQSPGGRTTRAVGKTPGHTFTPANNRQRGFDAGGLPNYFEARAPDELLPMVTLTWDPPSLADGAGVTSSAITITGAAFGDTVTVGAPYDLQGITCTGYVSAADTARIRLQNESGGTINLGSGDWKVTVSKALLVSPMYS